MMQNKEYFEKEAQELRIELMKLKEENRVYQEILFDFLSAKVRHTIPLPFEGEPKRIISIPEKHFELEVDYKTFVHRVQNMTDKYNTDKIPRPPISGNESLISEQLTEEHRLREELAKTQEQLKFYRTIATKYMSRMQIVDVVQDTDDNRVIVYVPEQYLEYINKPNQLPYIRNVTDEYNRLGSNNKE